MDYDSLDLPEEEEPLQSVENLRSGVTSLILELAAVIKRTDKLDQLASSHRVPKISKTFKYEGSGNLDDLCDDEDVFCGFGPDPTETEFENSGDSDSEAEITYATISPKRGPLPVSGWSQLRLSEIIFTICLLFLISL